MALLCKKIFNILMLLTASLLLNACISMPESLTLSLPKTEAKEFDGIWNGRLTLSIGEEKCVRRTQITVKINGSALSGRTKFKNYDAYISGVVGDDGNLVNGRVNVARDFYSYDITGDFKGDDASGSWKNKSCMGKWKLHRIRRNVL